jgi:hypothetical protein
MCYPVLFESITEMQCSLFTDFITVEVECGKCLCEMMIDKCYVSRSAKGGER